jgi:ABC-type Na+ efflux pump permease subunit
MEPEKKSSHGALIGSIIIVLVLIVGGIYLWQQKAKETKIETTNSSITSDEVSSLEQEVNSVNTDVDVNLDSIE